MLKNSDRRESQRKTLKARIFITGEVGEGIVYLDARDLSLGGVFLESELLFEIGDELTLEFFLPNDPEPVRAKGKIVRVNKDKLEEKDELTPGMGVEFTELDKENEDKILKFLEL